MSSSSTTALDRHRDVELVGRNTGGAGGCRDRVGDPVAELHQMRALGGSTATAVSITPGASRERWPRARRSGRQ